MSKVTDRLDVEFHRKSTKSQAGFCQHTGWCEVVSATEIECWDCGRTVWSGWRTVWRIVNLVALVIGGSFVCGLGILASKWMMRVFS